MAEITIKKVNNNINIKSYKPKNSKTSESNSINSINTAPQELNITENNLNNTYLTDILATTGATTIVGASKIIAGTADVVENISEGVLWNGGKIISGITYLLSKGASTFNKELESELIDWNENFKKTIKNEIEYDVVNNIENTFYNSKIGTIINDNSKLKYDSNSAETIENISKLVSELAIATGATILTGTVVTPMILGYLKGTGEQANITYKNNKDNSIYKETGILVSGLAESARWYALSRLGSSIQRFRDTIIDYRTNPTIGIENNIRQAAINANSNNTIPKLIRNALSTTFKNPGDWIDVSGAGMDNISDWLNDNEKLTAKTFVMAVGEVGFNVLLNNIFNGASEYLKSFKTSFKNSRVSRFKSFTNLLINIADETLDVKDGDNINISLN